MGCGIKPETEEVVMEAVCGPPAPSTEWAESSSSGDVSHSPASIGMVLQGWGTPSTKCLGSEPGEHHCSVCPERFVLEEDFPRTCKEGIKKKSERVKSSSTLFKRSLCVNKCHFDMQKLFPRPGFGEKVALCAGLVCLLLRCWQRAPTLDSPSLKASVL